MIINRLKVIQAERNISNRQLAEKANTSITTISRIRNRWLQADLSEGGLLDNLCKALDCQPGDILKYEDVSQNETL